VQQNTCAVWAENWEAMTVFLEMADQWEYPPMGGKPFRLNAVTVFKWLELTNRQRQARQLWPDVRTIAAAALECWQQET